MSIAKMKKLRLCGLLSEREEILNKLQLLGSVEVSDVSIHSDDPEYEGLLNTDDTALSDFRTLKETLVSSLGILNTYSPKKSGLFPKKRIVSEKELFDAQNYEFAFSIAESLKQNELDIARLHAEESKIRSSIASLLPWKAIDVPLETSDTKDTSIVFGMLPAIINLQDFEMALKFESEAVQTFVVSTDRDQHYLMIIYHKSAEESVGSAMRSYGFVKSSFDGYTGTAASNIAKLEADLKAAQNEVTAKSEEIKSLESGRESLRLCIDNLETKIAKEEAKLDLLSTEKAFALEGWIESVNAERLINALKRFCCAYELTDPVEEEYPDVPIKLNNNAVTAPLMVVTEMYSLPSYDGIDPNPLIMPFFTMFFGIMYADLGYGIILMLASLFITLKFKPEGTIGKLIKLIGECGVWSAIVGLFTGAFFGNAIASVAGILGKEVTSLPGILNYLVNPVVDPMSDPLTVLIIALAIGCVQIVVGMAIKGYMLIRDGQFWDAVFDVGSWWLLFAGIGVGAVTGSWNVALAGAAALILTQGRAKKGIISKLIGGISSLYDITSYFGDILSYSRLMTLLLAGGVIASIVNMLGSMTGNIFAFAIIFVIGHVFNMGINIIGTYVHSARLQYLEYFGKFYKEGGKPFTPLKIKTNYVSLKEDK